MRWAIGVGLFCAGAAEPMLGDDRCPFDHLGTTETDKTVLSKKEYTEVLKSLDIKQLYLDIVDVMTTSERCWPADGPQDGDIPSYAGLFGRLAWHCSGSFRLINETHAAGGCEGARQRFWPENEWRDNANLDKARGILGKVKAKYGTNVSWGDLMTFAGTVGLKASGGPAKKFCFGRVDDVDGTKSVQLGVEGVQSCADRDDCSSHAPCEKHFQWPEQNETDHFLCELAQSDGRLQASHSVGLIYVFPEGPQLKSTEPDYNPRWKHNRSPKLSAKEVRQTFKDRMGWTDRETVALIGGGHTLGRTHGNCDLTGSKFAGYAGTGPFFEAVPGSGRGPTDGTCGTGLSAGYGPNTVTSGFDGAWTRTPSRWNYDYFPAMFSETWTPSQSASGNDQWAIRDSRSAYANTYRLTADLALINDDIYRPIAEEYAKNPDKFDSDFADAWYAMVHRSANHPKTDDLEKDVGFCTNFDFVPDVNAKGPLNVVV